MNRDQLADYVDRILNDPFRSCDHAPGESGAPYFVIDGDERRVVRDGYTNIGYATVTANRLEDGRTVCFVEREMFVLPRDARAMRREIHRLDAIYEKEFERECREYARAERLAFLNDGSWDSCRSDSYTTYYG